MIEIYILMELELYYFQPYKLWEKTKYYGYQNPFAQRYINWNKLLLLKGHYGYGFDSSIGQWRPVNKNEI